MWRAVAIAALCASPLAAQDFFTLKGHGGPIMDIAAAPQGLIATASFDNSVGMWEGTTPRWLEGHRAAVTALNFDAAPALLSGGDDYRVLLWLPERQEPMPITQHLGKVGDIAVSPDGTRIATASWDGSIHLVSLAGSLRTSDARPDVLATQALDGHRSNVTAVAFAPGGDLFSASSDGTLRVWEGKSDDVPASRALVNHGFGINRIIVTGDWVAYGAVDGGTRIVDPQTGDQIADFTLDRRPILAMAYHAHSGQLAVGDGEGYIMMIDTTTMKITRDFRATRQGPVWALAFSPDGQSILAGGIEDIAYSWPVATLTEYAPMAGQTRSFLENPDALPNGERQFKRKCSICHTLTQGSARRAGPSLHGLFGRPAGSVSDYTYSRTLDQSDIIWSEETINALFDLGPDHYIPGTKMPMQRIVRASDRADLIEYLRTQTVQGED